jgi:dTDP-4-dehydrorhamnose reductase
VKILVTGGAGYLGAEVCRQAVASGHDVIATQLHAPAPHGRAVRLDLRDDGAVQRLLMRHGPELVVHTAYRQADEALEGDVVRATRNVTLASHRAGARLVHVSTDLVFDGEEGAPYAEDAEPRPVSAYGQAKLDAERLVRELHPEALIVRTSLLYGLPSPGPQERMALLAETPFYVDEIRSPVHAGELAAALLELGPRDDVPRLLHVAGPDAVSRYELARRIRAAHGHDPDAVTGAPSPLTGRARDVALDSRRAASLLSFRLRGVREILG